ncbi:MAG: RNA 2',3'-cyclic phosphodiesterase [Deltaproteobacteria bacterium]|nr:RNA 2',3'-cyclic phosphodiesterase [Deltaproteobacteria bacterium]
MKLRSFLAFDIPPQVKQTLATLIEDLRRHAPSVQWGSSDQLHVTLRFFGNVEEGLLGGDMSAAIARVTEETPQHRIECAGLGVFPNWKYPRIIWAGFTGDTEPVITLHDRLHEALSPFPLAADDRAFRLHLTLGRAKRLSSTGRLMKVVESLGPIAFGAVPIDHLTLYKSRLTRTGSIYTPLQQFPLRAVVTAKSNHPVRRGHADHATAGKPR